MLSTAPSSVTHSVQPHPSLVEVYARTRMTLPRLIDALKPVAGQFRPPP